MGQYRHNLIERQGRYACTVCRWRWDAPPADDCPGVRRYAWSAIPPQLATRLQLERAGLAQPAGPAGCAVNELDGALVWLYDRSPAGAPDAPPSRSARPAALPSQPPAARPVSPPSQSARPVPPASPAPDAPPSQPARPAAPPSRSAAARAVPPINAAADAPPSQLPSRPVAEGRVPAASSGGTARAEAAGEDRCRRCGQPEDWLVEIVDGICDRCRRHPGRPPAAQRAAGRPAPEPARCSVCQQRERLLVRVVDGVCDNCRRQERRVSQLGLAPAPQPAAELFGQAARPAPRRPAARGAAPKAGSASAALARIKQPAGRRETEAWAARLVEQADGWVVLDTETTGTHASAEVVDIAVIAPDGATLLESLVRPQGRMNAGAAQVHGISPAQLRGAPSFDQLYPELARVLEGKIALAYNVSFDGRILGFCCLQAGLPALAVSWGCVLAAFRAYAPGQRHRLLDACAHFRLTPGTHRARADALATLHVLRAIAGAPPLPPERPDQA